VRPSAHGRRDYAAPSAPNEGNAARVALFDNWPVERGCRGGEDIRAMKRLLPFKVLVPIVLGVLLPLVALVFAEQGFRELEATRRSTAASFAVQTALSDTVRLLAEAEAGFRAYLMTGREAELEPYLMALPGIEKRMRALSETLDAERAASPEGHGARLTKLVDQKVTELKTALGLYRSRGRTATPELLAAAVGSNTMSQIRAQVRELQAEEESRLAASVARRSGEIFELRLAMQLLTAFSIALLVLVAFLARREFRLRERRHASMLDERRRLEAAVDQRMTELAELSSHLQQVSEAEKSKLARDIHDELGSILVAAKMDVAWAHGRVTGVDGVTAAKLRGVLGVLDQAIAIKRRMTEELRPTLLDNLGLGAAIQAHVAEVCGRAGLAHEVTLPEEEPDLPDQVAVALFRIVQEALTNVVRYAKARNVTVALSRSAAGVALVFADDGVGLPPPDERRKRSHGILGMQQRVRALRGELVIKSTPGSGARIEVFVPLREQAAEPVSVPPEPLEGERRRR